MLTAPATHSRPRARSAGGVVAELERRGQLWSVLPGVIGMKGELLALHRALEERIARVCRAQAPDEWLVPAAVDFGTLARAEYFASFPQWLTTVSHLGDDAAALERLSTTPTPTSCVSDAVEAPRAALPPAVCYHAYAALAGRVITGPITMTAQCTCWRHEGGRTAALERGWAFTMREAVVVGSAEDVRAFREDGLRGARGLADALGLRVEVAEATDPFFAPSARGRELLQRVKALKHELLAPIGDARMLPIASFNDHETFFGDCFDMRLPDGRPASTGCVAFGLERWLLAFLCAHGLDDDRRPG